MATEAQYRCFKEIHQAEQARQEQLIERGKVYLSVITLYFGLLAVAADEIRSVVGLSRFGSAVYLASFAALVVALGLVVRAMGIYRYVYPTDPETVIQSLEGWPSDAEFFDDRIAELAAAFKTNHPINERRADLLRLASYGLLVAIALQAVVLSLLLFAD